VLLAGSKVRADHVYKFSQVDQTKCLDPRQIQFNSKGSSSSYNIVIKETTEIKKTSTWQRNATKVQAILKGWFVRHRLNLKAVR